jgi:hypothetical protein
MIVLCNQLVVHTMVIADDANNFEDSTLRIFYSDLNRILQNIPIFSTILKPVPLELSPQSTT